MEIVYKAYVAFTSSSGGLGRGGLITIVIVAVILIMVVVWLHRNTGNPD